MGAGKGVDGSAEAAQPVVLKMDLHCAGCADKVKKAIKRVPGVESIAADVAAKRVVVAGTADAAALKARIEAKTRKAVEVVSAGSGKKADKDGGGAGEAKAAADKGGAKEGDKDASPKEEEKEKKQPPEETKPKEDTVLLRIRLHCDGCADRIRRRIYKFKGVKDVALDLGNAKDEVKVTGTMDLPALLAYLREKLNRPVDAVAPGKKDGGEAKKDKAADSGDKSKDAAAVPAAAGGGEDDKKGSKSRSIDAAGPSTAAAAAFMAPPAEASTYHVTPPYGYVAYPQGPAPSGYAYPYYGNADGMGGMGYASNPSSTYYHQPQPYASYPEAGQHQGYPPYPYRLDMAPPPQLFSDENPNACSVM